MDHSELLEQQAAVWMLNSLPGIGKRRLNQLLRALARSHIPPGEALGSRAERLCARCDGLDPLAALALQRCAARDLDAARDYLATVRQRGVEILTIQQGDYPRAWPGMLGNDAPPLLFLKGNALLLEQSGCAVVGTRSPSREGCDAARRAAEAIVAAGHALVSGGAVGVDSAAHEAAVEAGKTTLVLLPQGIYGYLLPPSWRAAMDEGRLLLISEHAPETGWQTHAAVSRNAYIAAQSRLVCVVEPRKQGGSLMTARHALAQGKPIFVMDGSQAPREITARALPLEALDAHLAGGSLDSSPAESPSGDLFR